MVEKLYVTYNDVRNLPLLPRHPALMMRAVMRIMKNVRHDATIPPDMRHHVSSVV